MLSVSINRDATSVTKNLNVVFFNFSSVYETNYINTQKFYDNV